MTAQIEYGTASENESAGSPQSSLFNHSALGDVTLQQIPTSLGSEALSNYLTLPSYRSRVESDWDAFVPYVPSNQNNSQQGIGVDQYPTPGQSSLFRDAGEGTSSVRG